MSFFKSWFGKKDKTIAEQYQDFYKKHQKGNSSINEMTKDMDKLIQSINEKSIGDEPLPSSTGFKNIREAQEYYTQRSDDTFQKLSPFIIIIALMYYFSDYLMKIGLIIIVICAVLVVVLQALIWVFDKILDCRHSKAARFELLMMVVVMAVVIYMANLFGLFGWFWSQQVESIPNP